MLAIYKKEMKTYFNSMIGYVYLALAVAVLSLQTYMNNLLSGPSSIANTLSGFFPMIALAVFVPFLTMRIMSEEKKQRTDQLLLTSPVSVEKIVFGKFLSLATIFAMEMIVVALLPVIISSYGKVNFVSSYTALAGYFLMGLAFLSLGFFISTCSENQIIAVIVSFVSFVILVYLTSFAALIGSSNRAAFIVAMVIAVIVCGLLYYMLNNMVIPIAVFVVAAGILAFLFYKKESVYDGFVLKLFSALSPMSRFDTFISGTLDLDAVVYFISFIFVFLFLSVQTVKKRRWQ